ncbi:tyrosine-type recombinase/integrase [Methylocaldum sp.]|uniref:tyrosine-type recombinase/integrase n=1 Tax=Methylocaldum sp. TaxID=1969727 RepID=UPI002D4E1944|nr:integrase arm-type DNA-binding domain-containing protein [Methylocaldum sp.]HYE35393.1 integrase arm-type DNA-binding domain-containing protein [Methylocaldum sp.]
MPLTDNTIRNAKALEKPVKLSDAGGLFLLVTPTGGKWWRLKYRFEGKEKLLSLGTYPQVTLKEAREKRDEAKRLLKTGIDPSAQKKATKTADAETFEAVYQEWLAKFSPRWAKSHTENITRRIEKDMLPWIGKRPIAEIKPAELLTALRRIEARGALESAHRTKQACGQVFRYAVATGRAERDPTGDLRGALPPPNGGRFAAITEPKQVGDLLRAIEAYQGSFIVRCALRLAPLVFVRPGELRQAEWAEFDRDRAEWRIPAAKMKMKDPHIVPLSSQALAILAELYPLTGSGRYVFPSVRTKTRPMSDGTVNGAIRRMGYGSDDMTAHGFRAMACSILNEQGWNRDAIERQLAHAERNGVRAAYHRAEHLPERRRMMQAWADYLDGLKQGAEIIRIDRVK